MSKFTINFQANTTGIHHVGYRTYTDTPNTYNVIDVNVTTIGLQSVDINVEGNLYCAYDGIIYTGYIIADCQDQTDSNSDGIPDIATTWSVKMEQQTDPCSKTTITCNSVSLSDINVTANGSDYVTPPAVNIVGGNGSGATAIAIMGDGIPTNIQLKTSGSAGSGYNDGTYVNVPILRHNLVSTDGTGLTVDVTINGNAVTAIAINNAGSNYTNADNDAPLTLDDSYNNLGNPDGAKEIILNDIAGTGYSVATNISVTGGTGTGLTIDIIAVNNGDITEISINNPGRNYTIGDVISIQQAGSSNDETFNITDILTVIEADIEITCAGHFASEVADVTITNNGSGYTTTPTITFTGSGSGATADAVLATHCNSLTLSDYACMATSDLSATSDYEIALGDSIVICTDNNALSGLPTEFSYSNTAAGCHCDSCRHITIAATGASSGVGKVTYQTCWDTSNSYGSVTTVSRIVNFDDVIDLGCVLEDTITFDDGTLDASIIKTNVLICS